VLIKMGGRFPDDLARLRKKYQDYKSGGDPALLEGMKSEDRRAHYRELCVVEFRSEAITLGILWGLTLIAALYSIGTIIGIVRMILSAFSRR
jgi:hypothetical protein